MCAACDFFVWVVCFELERNDRPIRVDDARGACDGLSGWCCSDVFYIDSGTDRGFIGVEKWQDCFSRGVFQKPDQPGCAKNGRQFGIGKVNNVLIGDNERDVCVIADFREAFHGGNTPGCDVA